MSLNIIKTLAHDFGAHVPIIVADNPQLCCFLMHDAGIPLHHFLKQSVDANILIQFLLHYTHIQILTAGKIAKFIALGVPDWRLDNLPKLYRHIIEQETLLTEEGMSKREVQTLHELTDTLVEICNQLSQFNIPQTFGHCDFHDKNILVDTKTNQTTMIDLGEVCITHPFFSLMNCLHRVQENLSLPERQYLQLQRACLENWFSYESPTNLQKILSLIHRCWSIHALLGEYRLMESVDLPSFRNLHRQGRLAEKLRCWLAQANIT